MLIIGLDYHPSFQQIAFVDSSTGEISERRLDHPKEAEQFYRELYQRGVKVRVGMDASGPGRRITVWYYGNKFVCTSFKSAPESSISPPPADCEDAVQRPHREAPLRNSNLTVTWHDPPI